MTTADERRAMVVRRYPRSAAYDLAWVAANQMGPNALWLTESLSEVMPLEQGMRVLDLGCGRAMSSVFLAREFDVEVWATDLWVDATTNWTTIREAGLADRVRPIHAEAHTLPFADQFFDAIVSVDAYQYFGTDDLYLEYVGKFLRPGGRIGIVAPSLAEELETLPPPSLAPHWEPDFCCWHGPDWWRRHWEKTGLVAVEHADSVPDGRESWLHWAQDIPEVAFRPVAELLKADSDNLLGFSRVVARVP